MASILIPPGRQCLPVRRRDVNMKSPICQSKGSRDRGIKGSSESGSTESDCSSVSICSCTYPVYYMSPRNQDPKSSKFSVYRSLVIAAESPLSHPLSCLVNRRAMHPAGNTEGHSPLHADGHLARHSACCQAGYVPENLASNRENCLACTSAGHSADSPDNRRAGNTESSPPSNEADNPLDSSADCLVNSLPGCPDSYPTNSLPRQDDLPDRLRLEACGLRLFSHEVDARRQRPYVIRARLQVQHLPPADVQQDA